MSANVTPNSLRRTVRPIYDVYEEDDEKRRDSSGRKRVDVIQCLLDSSSDEIDDKNDNIEQIYNILWLTFDEICHIRYVITRTNLSLDKQYSQIHHGKICFRCRKKIDEVFFLLSLFRRTNNHEICFICKQIICEKCSYFNFQLPSSKLPIPVRIQTLIKPPSVSIDDKKEKIKKSNKEAKTICYDCLQIFKEHINTSEHPISPVRRASLQSPSSPFRRNFSLPPASSKSATEGRHTRHRRRPPLQKTELITKVKNQL